MLHDSCAVLWEPKDVFASSSRNHRRPSRRTVLWNGTRFWRGMDFWQGDGANNSSQGLGWSNGLAMVGDVFETSAEVIEMTETRRSSRSSILRRSTSQVGIESEHNVENSWNFTGETQKLLWIYMQVQSDLLWFPVSITGTSQRHYVVFCSCDFDAAGKFFWSPLLAGWGSVMLVLKRKSFGVLTQMDLGTPWVALMNFGNSAAQTAWRPTLAQRWQSLTKTWKAY